jgi:hypothetical protein
MDKYIIDLAREVKRATEEHKQACYNGSIMQQVGASERLSIWKQAFAVVTGTAVNGMYFKKLLEDATKMI